MNRTAALRLLPLAYVVGFAVLGLILGWHPDPPHKLPAAVSAQTPGMAAH